jgi:hypothetical protein
MLKKRNKKEEFHPGAYGEEGSDDGRNGAEGNKEDRDAAAFESSVDDTLIKDEYKKRHVPLYKCIHELYLEAQKPLLPVLPNFEKVVAKK